MKPVLTDKIFDEMTLYEKLDLVRTRPGMYIGDKCVSTLHTFIGGFHFALPRSSPKLQSEGHLPFSFFNEYVAERYNCPAPMGWANMFLEACNGSEEEGLKLFFEVLDDFRALRIEKVWLLRLTEENIHYNRTQERVPQKYFDALDYFHNTDNHIPGYSDAEAIYRIRLSNGAMLLAVKTEGEEYAQIEDWWYHASSIREWLGMYFGEIREDAWEESDEDFRGLLLHF